MVLNTTRGSGARHMNQELASSSIIQEYGFLERSSYPRGNQHEEEKTRHYAQVRLA